MKFAKELEAELVPEWRAKYMNYKEGKKRLKALARAYRNLTGTPRAALSAKRKGIFTPRFTNDAIRPQNLLQSAEEDTARRNFPNRNAARTPDAASAKSPERNLATEPPNPINVPGRAAEKQPLHESPDYSGFGRYGSIIGTPPEESDLPELQKGLPSLELPGPALHSSAASHASRASKEQQQGPAVSGDDRRGPGELGRTPTTVLEPIEARSPAQNSLRAGTVNPSIFRRSTTADRDRRPSLLRRVTLSGQPSTPSHSPDVPVEAHRELDFRQYEFHRFLNEQLDKIELFYREKEVEATERLVVLRQQLHIMRDQRLQELQSAKGGNKSSSNETGDANDPRSGEAASYSQNGETNLRNVWTKPLVAAKDRVSGRRFGKTTHAMQGLATPEGPSGNDLSRDYTRRSTAPEVPYRTAKPKLKLALQEYYRGLELLKSYVLLNRTAFRKINKKYDKLLNTKSPMRFMNGRVNKAWFVQSDVLDRHIKAVEDLYARYFERGSHKIAAGKLRAKMVKHGEFGGNMFRNGLMLGLGAVFGIQALVRAAISLYSDDEDFAEQTGYLLQIYGGYFMILAHFFLFCLACRFWAKSKINYVFVFEFDNRSHLDWRQVTQLPSFFTLLLGLTMWFNFEIVPGGETLYLYWPVILMGITIILMFLPVPYFYHKTRQWLLYTLWRLFFSGLYPVEFRDFFMGDMLCSQTYSMGNIELFFCLYAQDWDEPPMCNSNHSRLLGFFTTLPGIWRALQCLRRYKDTRNVFPHLVNFGKYTFTILQYMSLSLYRIDRSTGYLALFIAVSSINSIYCSIWDLAMDWSLLDPYAPNRFLRKTLGYRQPWIYYTAMLLDPILRFNWIFYVIFSSDLQHSALLSFVLSLSEILRRGMWTLFRVENEHCTNVGRFRASRDVPLPFSLPDSSATSLLGGPDAQAEAAAQEPGRPATGEPEEPIALDRTHTATGVDVEQADMNPVRRHARSFATHPSPMVRGLSTMAVHMHEAHAQDFERKKVQDTGEEEASSDEDGVEEDEEGGLDGKC